MSDSIPPIQFPTLSLLTLEETNQAIVRSVLSKSLPDPDGFMSAYDINWRIAKRIIGGIEVTSIVILGVTPKPPPKE